MLYIFRVELLITLEGIVEQSGNTVQARTSFLPSEILWGHTFTNCVTFANKEVIRKKIIEALVFCHNL